MLLNLPSANILQSDVLHVDQDRNKADADALELEATSLFNLANLKSKATHNRDQYEIPYRYAGLCFAIVYASSSESVRTPSIRMRRGMRRVRGLA